MQQVTAAACAASSQVCTAWPVCDATHISGRCLSVQPVSQGIECVCPAAHVVCLQGRDGAAALFDRLKVGAVVALRGKPQQHPQPASSSGGMQGTGQHQAVLDVVVQEVRVLHKNR